VTTVMLKKTGACSRALFGDSNGTLSVLTPRSRPSTKTDMNTFISFMKVI